MLFVVGAMAALSIDVVTFYTARSEAQIAADGAALAGARVLANSGMTSSNNAGVIPASKLLAIGVATQVAQQNQVAGRFVAAGEITVTFPNDGSQLFQNNPHITVQVKRTDLPTFFARMWGSQLVTVAASATAEAYNPSGTANGTTASEVNQVAPLCVKPWLLPNLDPQTSAQIFDPLTGQVLNPALLGSATPYAGAPELQAACDDCTPPLPNPKAWQYYPGSPSDFHNPLTTTVACAENTGFSDYQLRVAGCVTVPIACNTQVSIDASPYLFRDIETAPAVNCLTHATNSAGDSVDPAGLPNPPYQFRAGDDNPLVKMGAIGSGTDSLVSDSLVTVPVFNNPVLSSTTVNIVGFVQLFLNPDGKFTPPTGQVQARIINLVGCGAGATGAPVFGNGASAVPVRLIGQ